MTNARTKKAAPQTSDPRTPLIEWLLGGVGVVLVLACVAFLVYEGMINCEQPGAITTSVTDVTAAGTDYVVTFEIHNGGSQTLSNLHLSARLFDGEREVEHATAVIDYLPGRSSEAGGFYFRRDPRELRLEIRPEGFQRP